jgi:hypothetical protein
MRHKTPRPRFAPGVFVGLVAIFAILGQTKPVIGLAGLGTVLVVTAALVEVNRQLIWENYRKSYRQRRGLKGLWTKPNQTYYNINVMFLWPFIIFLGLICLWVAYSLA